MRSIALAVPLAALAAFSFACSIGTEEEVEVDPTRSAGAGQIFRADAGLDALIPANAQIEKIAGGYIFTEGPLWVTRAWEGQPFLLFSDVPGNVIYKWDPQSNQASEFKNPVFEGQADEGSFIGSNGLTLDAEGNLLVCEHGNRRISKVTPAGQWSVLVDRYDGKRLNSPNDLTWGPNGWLYFTDPPYGLAGQDEDEAKDLDFNGVFRVAPDGKTIEQLERRMTRPNGIGFSPDGKLLYVGNSDPDEKLWMVFPVKDDGTLGLGRKFADVTYETAEGLPDGLKLDNQGNLFATGPGGVWIYSPDGTHLGTIQPEEVPANVGWGGDGTTLYMTARTGVYRIKLSTGGKIP
ncbi:MAG: SMP-30/gluconolactonase/LRE family protein [Acidobacteria bacterium]|nr:SMP-30/gluconolactonase/LRE family protein [Acidobacteriota bacterium]